jgi:hypothetical protein
MTASGILVVEGDRRLATTLERVLSAEGPPRERTAAATSPALADASLEVDVGLGAEAVVVEVPEDG